MKIFLDVSETFYSDTRTGIQRVAMGLIDQNIEQFQPIVLEPTIMGWKYRNIKSGEISWDKPSRQTPLPSWLREITLHLMSSKLYPISRRAKLHFTHIFRPSYWKTSKTTKRPAIGSEDIVFCPDSFWSSGIRFDKKWRVLRANGTRILLMVHDIIPVTHPYLVPRLNRTLFLRSFDRILTQVDRIVCPSPYVESTLREMGIDVPTDTIPLATAVSRMPPKQKQTKKKNEVISLLFVGTLEKRKGIYEVCRVLMENRDLRLQINLVGQPQVGPLGVGQVIAQMAEKDNRIIVHGRLNDFQLQEMEANTHFGLCPSYVEGFDLPFWRFVASGIPVIASDIGAHNQLSQDEGVLFFRQGLEEDILRVLKLASEPDRESTNRGPRVLHARSWRDVGNDILYICLKDFNEI